MIRRAFLGAAASALFATTALARAGRASGPVVKRQQGALTLENIPETPPDLREGLRRYQNARSAAFQDWLADGSMLMTTRFGQTSQLHHIAGPGDERYQLTFFDEPVGGATALPGSADLFVFSKDTGGDEYFQLYLAGLSRPERAFTTPGTRNQSLVFSKDGRRVAWAEVGKGDPDYRVRIAEVKDGKIVAGGETIKTTGATSPVAFSPDGRTLLLSRYISAASSKIFIREEDRPLREINPSNDPIAYEGGLFAPDGQSILIISDQDYEFKRLVAIDLSSGRISPITSNDLSWDIEAFDLSNDGKALAYAINENGRSKVVVRDFRTRRALPQPILPVGVLTGLKFSPDSQSLAIGLNAATSPADVWNWSLRSASLTRWTTSESGGLDPAAMVEPTLVTFRSFDGLEVPAWVSRPMAAKGPVPVIIDIHGGPESQDRPGFNSRRQYWTNELGVAVIAPNVRGSEGYGKTYVALDNGPKRQDSSRTSARCSTGSPPSRTSIQSRVVVYGGSYGGYMVLASLAHYQ